MQVLIFSGFLLFLLPVIVIQGSGSTWLNPAIRPAWQIAILAQVLAVPALVGLTAIQEFTERGSGTPVPFDPPQRLVTTGVYAYVRNPMQFCAVALLLLLGLILHNAWVSGAAIMAFIYCAGLAGWDEGEDLQRRFGNRWTTYGQSVRPWLPRWLPWHSKDAVAQLFVSERCDMCREVGRWFEHRGARGLVIVAAEAHVSGGLTRITYESGDGTRAAVGVEAIGRALEHIHLGWALLGFLLRLPVLRKMSQLLVDASGGEARRISANGRDETARPPDACRNN
jgi:protein-S-isoprenylcysteine O-methyltransferase Ste14